MSSVPVPSPQLPPELVQRIHNARNSGKLSNCEAAVLYFLVDLTAVPCACKGRAIKIAQIQGAWARGREHVWTDRQIKSAVKDLIETHNIPVCSSRERFTGGYYLAVKTADLEAAERPLRGEIISLAKRLKAFNPRSDFSRHLAGQLQAEGICE